MIFGADMVAVIHHRSKSCFAGMAVVIRRSPIQTETIIVMVIQNCGDLNL